MVLSLDKYVGKIAVVTGASSGIGFGLAKALVEHGCIVVGLARRVEPMKKLSQDLSLAKGKLYFIKTDITQEKEIIHAFKWIKENLGLVYVLINSAGCSKEGSLTDVKMEDVRKIFETNIIGLCGATREALKIMKSHNIKGHIIHINSILGHVIGSASKSNAYPATKFAITGLTETLRQELLAEKSKIKVTSVSPGLLETELTLWRDDITEERRKAFGERPKLNVEDIVDAVIYVLSTPDHVQSISPGLVATEMTTKGNGWLDAAKRSIIEQFPILEPEDIVDGIMYALSTPEHVQVHELIIKPVGELY